MRSKGYFVVILFLCVFLQAKATGLSSDIIILNGEWWELMAKPIRMDSTLYKRLMDFIPDNHCSSTANWDGYTAFWEIQEDYLCLQRLEVCVYDKASRKYSTLIYDAEALQKTFASYYENGIIKARWLNGELRAGKGELVRYVHLGFNRNVEIEQILHVVRGKVVEMTTYHNYKKPGLNMKEAQVEISRRFPWERFPEYKGQRLTFRLANIQMTNDGHFKDCDIRAIYLRMRKIIKDGNHPLAIAFKETLKSIYPWEILFINGKYTCEYRHFTMPIWEKYLENAHIVCINNVGKELFYVFQYDNGPDYVQEGLFRIVDKEGQVGFADTLGNVIIKPQFKFAYPFKDCKAKVTLKGERKDVPESDGEKYYWESDEWFYIDRKNKRLAD